MSAYRGCRSSQAEADRARASDELRPDELSRNADMIGHTGNYDAALKAMEARSTSASTKVVGSAEKSGSDTLIVTADHGNAEEMRDEQGRIHTQHTLNPVPAIWVAPGSAIAPKATRKALKDGGLQDVMPTLCQLMQIPQPPEATGTSLC